MSPVGGDTKREGRGPGHLRQPWRAHRGEPSARCTSLAQTGLHHAPQVSGAHGWGGNTHPLCATSARFGGDSRVLPVDTSCVSQEASGENPVQDALWEAGVPWRSTGLPPESQGPLLD